MNEGDYTQWAGQEIARLDQEMPLHNGEGREKTLFFDSLPISQWKSELEALKQLGNLEAVEKRELEIVGLIQQQLALIPYEKGRGTPEQMIAGGAKNCEGATILGSVALEQIGIDHRIIITESPTHQPGHTLILPISSNERVFWSEMTGINTSDPIAGDSFSDLDGNNLSVALRDLLSNDQERITLLLTDPKFRSKVGNEILGMISGLSMRVDLLSAEKGRKQILLDRHANNLSDTGDNETAEKVLQQMIQLGFDSLKTMSNLATMQARNGRLIESAITLETLVQRRPQSLKDWDRLASTYMEAGDSEATIAAYQRGIAVKPGAYLLVGQFAQFLIGVGRQEEGLEWLEQFIEREQPKFTAPYLDLAEHCVDLGKVDDALDAIHQLQKLGLNTSRKDTLRIQELSEKLGRQTITQSE